MVTAAGASLPDVASTLTEVSRACSRETEVAMGMNAGKCPSSKRPSFVWLNHPVEGRDVKVLALLHCVAAALMIVRSLVVSC